MQNFLRIIQELFLKSYGIEKDVKRYFHSLSMTELSVGVLEVKKKNKITQPLSPFSDLPKYCFGKVCFMSVHPVTTYSEHKFYFF